MHIRILLICFCFLSLSKLGAQDSLQTIQWGFDTNYVKRYNDRLAISIFQSQKSFEIGMKQKLSPDTAYSSVLNYIARANIVSGFTISYDKISFSLGLPTPATESEIAKKGKTKYSDYSLSFTSNRYRIELTYKNYKGFYEANTSNYDTTFTDTVPYFQRPDMQNLFLRGKFMYFFNKRRYSYSSAYFNTYRQMKSAGSLFVYSDFFYSKLASPTDIIPAQVQPSYGAYAHLNELLATGLTLGGGYTWNIVLWKRIYFNGVFGLASKFYQQNTSSSDGSLNTSVFKVGIAGADIRGALGYNAKNFFISITFNSDISVYKFTKVEVNNTQFGGNFSLGYRFPFKERKWVKKMKDNKYYKKL